jgi:hypothetical protein
MFVCDECGVILFRDVPSLIPARNGAFVFEPIGTRHRLPIKNGLLYMSGAPQKVS